MTETTTLERELRDVLLEVTTAADRLSALLERIDEATGNDKRHGTLVPVDAGISEKVVWTREFLQAVDTLNQHESGTDE